jgi:UDP-N-acetylmuramyl pentapeptide synthase
MVITLKLSDALAAHNALKALASTKVPVASAILIYGISRALEGHTQAFEAARRAAVEQYAIRGEDGQPIREELAGGHISYKLTDADALRIQEELVAALQDTVEIDISRTLLVSDLPAEVEPSIIAGLGDLLEV